MCYFKLLKESSGSLSLISTIEIRGEPSLSTCCSLEVSWSRSCSVQHFSYHANGRLFTRQRFQCKNVQNLNQIAGCQSPRKFSHKCVCHVPGHHPHSHTRSEAAGKWPPASCGPRQGKEKPGRLSPCSSLQTGTHPSQTSVDV